MGDGKPAKLCAHLTAAAAESAADLCPLEWSDARYRAKSDGLTGKVLMLALAEAHASHRFQLALYLAVVELAFAEMRSLGRASVTSLRSSGSV